MMASTKVASNTKSAPKSKKPGVVSKAHTSICKNDVGKPTEKSKVTRVNLMWIRNASEVILSNITVQRMMSLIGILCAIAICVVAVLMQVKTNIRGDILSAVPPQYLTLLERFSGMQVSYRAFKYYEHPIWPEDDLPTNHVSFTVHFNGEGLGDGVALSTADYRGLNDFIMSTCQGLEDVQRISSRSGYSLLTLCNPNKGARAFNQRGRRMFSLKDIVAGDRIYITPRGIEFVWPTGEIGYEVIPEVLEEVIPGKPIKLKLLSNSPRVFSVENFMTQEEIDTFIDFNKDLVTRSKVGYKGVENSIRTSSTAWDGSSWPARKVQRRSHALGSVDFYKGRADMTQILRYNLKEWYKPHTDYFEDGFENSDPSIKNGTNRFLTVFLYLTEVKQGGHTVFPMSTSHKGYNGEQIISERTRTSGRISQEEAEWACNISSSALKSTPVAGSALMFYSQNPDGTLDINSLHGGCPVLEGTKWSANVWIWNRKKPRKDNAANKLNMIFSNKFGSDIDLFWNNSTPDGVYMYSIDVDANKTMSTYHGHSFFANVAGTKEHVYSFTVPDNAKDGFVSEILPPINL